MPPRSIAVGFVHVTAYVLLSFVWVVIVSLLTLIPLVARGDVDFVNMGSPSDFVQALGPGWLGFSTLLQGFGLAGIAAALATLLPVRGERPVSLPGGADDLRARWKRAFALRSAPVALLVAGALGAVTVGWLPSWIMQELLERLPGYETTVELMAQQLLEGPALGRAVLLASIVIGAPIFEELIFRGYLWEAFERAGSPVFAWIGTSLLFAAYHQDPVHIVALLPTAFFIGWLRLASGSLWPAVAGHFVNNGLSAVLLLTTGAAADTEAQMPLWLGLLGYAVTCAICLAAWAMSRRARPPADRAS